VCVYKFVFNVILFALYFYDLLRNNTKQELYTINKLTDLCSVS